jgi:hypothetical protein
VLSNSQGKVKQIVGSTLRDSSNDGTALVTNFESDKSAAEFAKLYKEDELFGGHVIMLGADPASQASSLEALRAYPGEIVLYICCENCGCSLDYLLQTTVCTFCFVCSY